MTSLQACAALTLTALLISVPSVRGQQNNLHVGYVYPAGGQQGSAFRSSDCRSIHDGRRAGHVTGGGVQVEVIELIKPISGKELNELRIRIDELLARKAVVQQNFRGWNSSAASRTPSRSRRTRQRKTRSWRS